jgi:3-methyladenine DNA glycosylase Tag
MPDSSSHFVIESKDLSLLLKRDGYSFKGGNIFYEFEKIVQFF